MSRALFRHHAHLRWVWDVDREAGTYPAADLRCLDHAQAARVGQLLWDENVHSVQHRYPDCDDLPGPVGCNFG